MRWTAVALLALLSVCNGAIAGRACTDAPPTPESVRKAWLKQARYQSTLLKLGALERLGGRMFRANIAFDDHPNELRFSNQIYTVTVESIIAFVKRQDARTREIVLQVD